MKLKMIVVDLELSKRTKRWLGGCVGALVVLGGGAIAYASVPHTWNDGDLLAAGDLNGNFSNLDNRLGTLEGKAPPPTLTAWTVYTPVVTVGGAPINAVVDANAGGIQMAMWRRVGDTLEVQIATQFPTCQTAGELQWSLPSGLQPDVAKLVATNGYVGTALTVHPGGPVAVATANVLAQGSNSFVALQQGTSVVQCSTIGDGGEVRMTFALPITGWDVNN